MKIKFLLKNYKDTSNNIIKVLFFALMITLSTYTLSSDIAIAAKIIMSPPSSKSMVGKLVTVNLDIDPETDRVYTVKADIRFPSDLVSVDSWTFNKDWIGLRQPEYDSLNNSAGILVRSAGFTGGVIERKRFGTIIFKTKTEGTATISINGKSFTLDADGNNKNSSNGTATIIINKSDIIKENKIDKPNQDKVLPLVYSSNVVKDNLYIDEPIIVLTKLKNDNAKMINAKVITTLYNNNGQVLSTKEDDVAVDTQTDTVQQLPITNINIGSYSVVNEITYAGQASPQKITSSFNVIADKTKEVPHVITDNEMMNYIWTNTMTWILLIAVALLCTIVGYSMARSAIVKNKKNK